MRSSEYIADFGMDTISLAGPLAASGARAADAVSMSASTGDTGSSGSSSTGEHFGMPGYIRFGIGGAPAELAAALAETERGLRRLFSD